VRRFVCRLFRTCRGRLSCRIHPSLRSRSGREGCGMLFCRKGQWLAMHFLWRERRGLVVDLLCVGFLKEGCRLYTAFWKTLAGCSFSCSSNRKTSIFHFFIGKPSISGGLSLYYHFISLVPSLPPFLLSNLCIYAHVTLLGDNLDIAFNLRIMLVNNALQRRFAWKKYTSTILATL
jgi:hypothetical protein